MYIDKKKELLKVFVEILVELYRMGLRLKDLGVAPAAIEALEYGIDNSLKEVANSGYYDDVYRDFAAGKKKAITDVPTPLHSDPAQCWAVAAQQPTITQVTIEHCMKVIFTSSTSILHLNLEEGTTALRFLVEVNRLYIDWARKIKKLDDDEPLRRSVEDALKNI